MSLKEIIRYRLQYPLRYRQDLLRAAVSYRGGKPCRILIASDNLAITSEQQFAPLLADRASAIRQHGLVFDQKLLDDVLKQSAPDTTSYQAMLVKISFLVPAEVALEKVRRIRELYPHPVRVLYFDGDDDSCVQWPAVLPLVDLYVKKHRFADDEMYGKSFAGKNNLTDYVSKHHGYSFTDNVIPSSGVVPQDQMGKIALGWNIGADSKITELFKTTVPSTPADKKVDVMCRAACKPDLWIYPFRGPIQAALEPLRAKGYTVNVPNERVDQDGYYREMRESRICVSPFGYGELCWRDFEAILMGCLLVKPDTGHIHTEPDIFQAGKTYVPVRWDFSDLAEVCEKYLQDAEAREAIVANAYGALDRYYKEQGYLLRFAELLTRAGVRQSQTQA